MADSKHRGAMAQGKFKARWSHGCAELVAHGGRRRRANSSTKNSEVIGRDEAGPLRRHRLNFESTQVEQLREEVTLEP
ncbi:hypothetical protein EJB05_49680, partial [Eragrostis curvula]